MKTIQIEIPEGKEAKWVDGVLTLVDEQPKSGFKFKVGDKAILNNEIPIRTSTEANLLRKGEEIEIIRVPCRDTQFYEIRYGESVGLVEDKDLTPTTSKVEFKFKVGDRVVCTTRSCYGVMEITQQLNRNGEPWYRLEYVGMLKEDELELYAEPQDITERIKTFEDACKWCYENGKRNLNHEYMEGVKVFENTKDILAYLKLRIITCALNEGWEPTFDADELRWEIKLWSEYPLDTFSYNQSDTCTMCVGKTLLFKSEEIAKYAATRFKDIYMDFCKGKE